MLEFSLLSKIRQDSSSLVFLSRGSFRPEIGRGNVIKTLLVESKTVQRTVERLMETDERICKLCNVLVSSSTSSNHVMDVLKAITITHLIFPLD